MHEPINTTQQQEGAGGGVTTHDARKQGTEQNTIGVRHTTPSTTGPLLNNTPIPVTPSLDALARNRNRINRLLMRRRWLSRISHKKRPTSRFVVAAAVLLIFLAMLVSSGTGAAYAYYQAQLPLLNGIAQHSLFQTTHIYDRNGQLLYKLYDHQQDRGRRTYVNYNDMSPLLVQATVAAEDHTFWTNSGVDSNGIARAALANVQSHGVVEGGSTITQQIIKNQFFGGQPRTVQIKGEEAVLAVGLTQQYPKWKIMEMYLNTVYYGDVNYGAEAAAQSYFLLQPHCVHAHCTPAVGQLDLAQASLLAGLPQSPSYYNPVLNKPVALERQKVVLQSMVALHMITPQQMQAAEHETAAFTFQPYSVTHHLQAPHFVNYVIDNVLIPQFGQRLVDGGFNVYTTLDLGLEKQIEQIVYNKLYLPQDDSYFGAYGPINSTNNLNNAAVVVQDPHTGEILAMDGSAKFDMNTPTMQGQDNAALALRQPGSSFKPIVYSTAFEMGWYPAMIIPNHKTMYPVPVDAQHYYTPQNYDGTFTTAYPMTVRNALANSLNIPAIDAMAFAGVPNVVNMAGRLGLKEITNLPPERKVLSMAIGSAEVSPLDMTGAYATFANGGVRVPQTSVLTITDSQGHLIYHFDTHHALGVRVMSAGVAFLMNSMLSDKNARHPEFPAGNPLEHPFPAAAKTGTTDNFKDNWTMGYTPHVAVGVWAGNSNNTPMTPNTIGITGAGPIWHDVMALVTQRYHFAPDDFAKPNDVHLGRVSALIGLLPVSGEPTSTDWFIDGTLPTLTGGSSFTYKR